MIRPKLNDSFDSEESVGGGRETSYADYLETIALLQDEVARLEQELQLHNEGQRESTWNDAASLQGEIAPEGALDNGAGRPEEVKGFNTELASRDDTIRQLLDELSRVEQAQAATQAEWEHLAGWVAELERRVEGQDGGTLHELENRLAAQQQKAEALEAKSERDRCGWEGQRQIYQEEIARLQETLNRSLASPEALGDQDGRVNEDRVPDANVVEALQAENLRLRAAWQELVERTAAADRCDSLDAKLAEAVNERQQLRRQLEQIQDQTKRERLEFEATVADLQARLSQASLTCSPETTAERISPELDIELRIRALRQNFREVDQRENEERREKHLITRLSRLWNRTGPR